MGRPVTSCSTLGSLVFIRLLTPAASNIATLSAIKPVQFTILDSALFTGRSAFES
jgi:hypothetical protein